MNNLLVKLYLTAALLQLGISYSDSKSFNPIERLQRVDKESKKVLKINWRPISVFPKEASKFK